MLTKYTLDRRPLIIIIIIINRGKSEDVDEFRLNPKKGSDR